MIVCRYRAWLEGGDASDLEPELASMLDDLAAQAMRGLRRADEADDALQDTVLDLLQQRARLPHDLPLEAVARTLLHRRIQRNARQSQRQRRRFCSWEEVDEEELVHHEPAAPELPSLKALPESQHAALFALAEFGDGASAAASLGVTLGYFHVLIHRARATLNPIYLKTPHRIALHPWDSPTASA